MKRIIWNETSSEERTQALARPTRRADPALLNAVIEIFETVREEGPAALERYSIKFDGAAPETLDIDAAIIADARAALDPEDAAALDAAAVNIRTYHEQTKPADMTAKMGPGVTCRRVFRPIERVGVYAPGGSAVLVSSLMMTAIPAAVAGVPDIIVTTPPIHDPLIRKLMIFTAGLCGVKTLHFIGGAQAIAALTFGIGAIPRADKIVGPGGAYVAAAKKYAASLPDGPAIDMPAGPSELMAVADQTGDPALIAADLLSQAEHDRDAQVLFVTTEAMLAEKVANAVGAQLQSLPRRDIARASLDNARMIIVDDLQSAADIANRYGPEHLSLAMKNASGFAETITAAGAIFVGPAAAESFGDYNCGPSHVLPTDGAARAWSGVSTETFMRAISIQEIDANGARALAEPAARLARLEGLEAHARAALARLEAPGMQRAAP